MKITQHAEKRIRKRMKIPKATVEAHFGNALLYGKKHNEFKGAFKRYLDGKSMLYRSMPIVYANTIFFVIGDSLVTAYPVPQKFKDYVK